MLKRDSCGLVRARFARAQLRLRCIEGVGGGADPLAALQVNTYAALEPVDVFIIAPWTVWLDLTPGCRARAHAGTCAGHPRIFTVAMFPPAAVPGWAAG